ncbi:unnamed protein product [Adineta steineri]|nr:unnamed protein product [Adineta steineri]
MISTDESNSNTTLEKSVFEGAPFQCKLSFYKCDQNLDASAPRTLVNNRTNLHKGDLFVISLTGEQKLVMQVDEERTDPSVKPEIRIDESIKTTFSVNSFATTYFTVEKVVAKEKFALYLVELQVKEQYLSRGDMWRFTRKLSNTTVYLKKSLEIFGMR